MWHFLRLSPGDGQRCGGARPRIHTCHRRRGVYDQRLCFRPMDIQYDPEREALAAMNLAAEAYGAERLRWINAALAWTELACLRAAARDRVNDGAPRSAPVRARGGPGQLHEARVAADPRSKPAALEPKHGGRVVQGMETRRRGQNHRLSDGGVVVAGRRQCSSDSRR